MMKALSLAACGSSAAFLLACAGARPSPDRLDANLGVASRRDVVQQVPTILRRHRFVIERREETTRSLFFQTEWLTRQPFEDEAERGFDAAQTRIVVWARARGAYFAVRLQAENRLSSEGFGSEWRRVAATPMFRDYIRSIRDDIEMEISAGVRIH